VRTARVDTARAAIGDSKPPGEAKHGHLLRVFCVCYLGGQVADRLSCFWENPSNGCRMNKRSIFAYLCEAVAAWANGLHIPSLIPANSS
jgi:hypothetical protein